MITRLDITPDYADGFSFSWEVDPTYSSSVPPVFTVQQGHTHEGPWEDISPELTNQYFWLGDGERVVHTREPILYFRVRAVAGDKTSYSSVVQPYGDLADKREFLIARNIRRQEIIQLQGMGGTCIKILVRAMSGPVCESCTDFVTGRSARQDCLSCFGTGITPGYHGPYQAAARFSTSKLRKGFGEGGKYVTEESRYALRTLGLPPLKKDDIVVDTETDRRYIVNTVDNVVEIRRIPIIQQAVVSEIPSSSPYYRIEV